MPLRQTLVGDSTGNGLYHADTVEYQGEPWLVSGGWLPAEQGGWMRPVRIVRPIGVAFQPGGAWADFVLQAPVPIGVLEGSEPVPDGQYEVVQWPDVLIEMGPDQ